MKITALLVLKSPAARSSCCSQQAMVLANSSDVSHFGYFQRPRPAAIEFILFVALHTPAGSRQSVAARMQVNVAQLDLGRGHQIFSPDRHLLQTKHDHSCLCSCLFVYPQHWNADWIDEKENLVSGGTCF